MSHIRSLHFKCVTASHIWQHCSSTHCWPSALKQSLLYSKPFHNTAVRQNREEHNSIRIKASIIIAVDRQSRMFTSSRSYRYLRSNNYISCISPMLLYRSACTVYNKQLIEITVCVCPFKTVIMNMHTSLLLVTVSLQIASMWHMADLS